MSSSTPRLIADHPDAPQWLRDDDTSDALVSITDGRVTWHSGVWLDGIWYGGEWRGGAGGGETGEDEE